MNEFLDPVEAIYHRNLNDKTPQAGDPKETDIFKFSLNSSCEILTINGFHSDDYRL